MAPNKNTNAAKYQATITLTSVGNESKIELLIEFNPPVEAADAVDWDTLPSAFKHALNMYHSYLDDYGVTDVEVETTSIN